MGPKKAFFLIVGIVALTIVSGGAVYYMADMYLSKKAQEISVLKADLEIVELKITSARQAQDDLQRLRFIEDITEAVLPPDKIQADLVGELIAFADKANVRLDAISFKPTDANATVPISQTEPLPDVPGVNALPVDLTVNGSYDNLLRFLTNIETNRRKMQVETLSMSPDEEEGTVSGSMKINVYVRTR
jgi:Tfp pilus assembly protein PilO